MNTIYENYRKMVFESNLNRLIEYMYKYDIAIISAYRGTFENVQDPELTYFKCYDRSIMDEKKRFRNLRIGEKLTNFEKIRRSLQLKYILQDEGYGVTNVVGLYNEVSKTDVNNSEVSMVKFVPNVEESFGKKPILFSEHSIFVVNTLKDKEFYKKLFTLSEWYNQDSFIYKPKGGHARLVGTNARHRPKKFAPGYNREMEIDGMTLTDTNIDGFTTIWNAKFAFIFDVQAIDVPLQISNTTILTPFKKEYIARYQEYLSRINAELGDDGRYVTDEEGDNWEYELGNELRNGIDGGVEFYPRHGHGSAVCAMNYRDYVGQDNPLLKFRR